MMGTARPTVTFIYIISFLFLWSTVVKAGSNPCDDCRTARCAYNCGSLAGKRSEVSNRDTLSDLRQTKASLGIGQQCTLDAWFEELPPEWQRHIIEVFQLASAYTEPA